MVEALEHVHLSLYDLVMAHERLLADDLDGDIDGRFCRLPYCAAYCTKAALAEGFSEGELALLAVGLWLLCQRIVDAHFLGSDGDDSGFAGGGFSGVLAPSM